MSKKVKKAITLVEIIVSAMLLASALAGIVATFVSTRRMVGRGTERVTAANLAREKLNGLYSSVRADQWEPSSFNDYLGSSELNEGVTHSSSVTVDNVVYDIDYDVADGHPLPGGGGNYDYKVANLSVEFIVSG